MDESMAKTTSVVGIVVDGITYRHAVWEPMRVIRQDLSVIVLKWWDAVTATSWTFEPETVQLLDIASSGFLITQDEATTRICLSLGKNGAASDVLAIPTEQVYWQRVLPNPIATERAEKRAELDAQAAKAASHAKPLRVKKPVSKRGNK